MASLNHIHGDQNDPKVSNDQHARNIAQLILKRWKHECKKQARDDEEKKNGKYRQRMKKQHVVARPDHRYI